MYWLYVFGNGVNSAIFSKALFAVVESDFPQSSFTAFIILGKMVL